MASSGFAGACFIRAQEENTSGCAEDGESDELHQQRIFNSAACALNERQKRNDSTGGDSPAAAVDVGNNLHASHHSCLNSEIDSDPATFFLAGIKLNLHSAARMQAFSYSEMRIGG
jgi:hypothetical protein